MTIPYFTLFRRAGTLGFFIAGLIARFPIAMVTLGLVLMLNATRGDYELSALVATSFILSVAIISPQLSRLADIYGQTRIALPALLFASAAFILLVVASHFNWPDWSLFVGAVCAGVMPNFAAFSRARWVNIYRGQPLLRTAFALESLSEEMLWITGPTIAVVFSTQFFPQAGVAAAALLMLVGGLAFCRQKHTEPPVAPLEKSKNGRSMILSPHVFLPAVILLMLGGLYGVVEVTTAAFAEAQGVKGLTFLPLAVYSAGSLAAGLVYGVMHWQWALHRQLLLVCLVLLLTSLPFFFVTNIWLLTAICLLSGTVYAPAFIIALSLIETLVEKERLTESMSWALTSPLIGMALGIGIAGHVIKKFGPETAFAAGVLFSLMAFVLAFLSQKSLTLQKRKKGQDGADGGGGA